MWGFTMELGALDSFFEADVSWNGHNLFKYSNSQIVLDPFESTSVVSTRVVGKTIIVSLLGEPSGEYRLVAHTRLSGGQIIEEKEKTVSFVSVLDSSDQEQIRNDLNVAQSTIVDLKNQNEALRQQLQNQNQTNQQQAQSLESQDEKLNTVEDALISLQQALGSFSDFDSQTSKQITQIKTGLDETNQKLEQKNASATGFFGFSDAGNLWMILLVVGIIAIGFFAWQWKQNNP